MHNSMRRTFISYITSGGTHTKLRLAAVSDSCQFILFTQKLFNAYCIIVSNASSLTCECNCHVTQQPVHDQMKVAFKF